MHKLLDQGSFKILDSNGREVDEEHGDVSLRGRMAEGYQPEGRGDHVEISKKGWEGRQLGTETASHVRGKDS